MALKAIMLRSKIDKKTKELNALREKDAEFESREKELETAIEEAETDEEQQTVSEQIDAFDEERKAHEDSKTKLQGEIESLERELEAEEQEVPQPAEERAVVKPKIERNDIKMNERSIRTLPMSVRALESLPMETRNQIIEREDVKDFLSRMRDMKGVNRSIKGGDLEIPIVFLELISENMYRYSKLLNRVRVRSIPGEARQTIAGTIPEAVWTEMCGAINELSFQFNQITLDGYKVAGYIPICNSLLEDTVSNLDLASWIVEIISESIALAEDKAILYGKGGASKMPLGIVTRLAQTTQPTGYPANAPKWESLKTSNIIKINGTGKTGAEFWTELMLATGNTYTPYNTGNQFWAMNSKTYAKLKSKLITFTATGDIVANLFNTLPIVNGNIDILEFIPDGDIIGGYGDMYLWIDRASLKVEASTEVQFIQDNTVFKGKARADGAPVIPGAFVAINIENKEVTTTMSFAADTANDADLSDLVIGTETLNPTFSADKVAYTIASASAESVKVEATTAQPGATVEITFDGKQVRNGGTIKLAEQAKDLVITVKNGNAVKVYTVNIKKQASEAA